MSETLELFGMLVIGVSLALAVITLIIAYREFIETLNIGCDIDNIDEKGK